jgi:hypothetical protein
MGMTRPRVTQLIAELEAAGMVIDEHWHQLSFGRS